MGTTYTSLHYHIVFSTKERLKIIDTNFKDHLFAYLAKTINNEYNFIRSCGANYFYKLSPELSLGATFSTSLSGLMLMLQSFNKRKKSIIIRQSRFGS